MELLLSYFAIMFLIFIICCYFLSKKNRESYNSLLQSLKFIRKKYNGILEEEGRFKGLSLTYYLNKKKVCIYTIISGKRKYFNEYKLAIFIFDFPSKKKSKIINIKESYDPQNLINLVSYLIV